MAAEQEAQGRAPDIAMLEEQLRDGLPQEAREQLLNIMGETDLDNLDNICKLHLLVWRDSAIAIWSAQNEGTEIINFAALLAMPHLQQSLVRKFPDYQVRHSAPQVKGQQRAMLVPTHLQMYPLDPCIA